MDVGDGSWRELGLELGSVKVVVWTRSGEYGEHLFGSGGVPGKVGVEVVSVEREHFVVRDDSRVDEVEGSSDAPCRKIRSKWPKVVDDGERVGDAEDLGVLDELRDHASLMEVSRDGVLYSEAEGVGILSEELLLDDSHASVEISIEVGFFLFFEAPSTSKRVLGIIGVDASTAEVGQVDVAKEAQIGQVDNAQHVGTNSLLSMSLAPIDVRSSSNSRSADNPLGFVFIQSFGQTLAILQTRRDDDVLLPSLLKHGCNITTQEARGSQDQYRRHSLSHSSLVDT